MQPPPPRPDCVISVSEISYAVDLSAKEPTMSIQATIDRLTAEKIENRREGWEIESEAIGRVWAMSDATIEQLKRVPATNDPLFNGMNDDRLHDLWHCTVFAVDDVQLVREFWNEWLRELAARGFPVDEVSVYDFTSGACDVHNRLLQEKPDLFR